MDPSLSAAKRLWHIVRVVYYMLRKGMSKHKLVLELNLLLKRGKLAGKAISNLLAPHHHHHHHHHSTSINDVYSSFSCRSMDPKLSFYDPKEVQFSCSNTPVYPSFGVAAKRKNRRRHDVHDEDYSVAAIAKAFEILNSEASMSTDESSAVASPSPSPSPLMWAIGSRTPAGVRQLRITDSPFPLREEENGEADGHVDEEAEVFIRRFYEQLRLQQRAPETPDYLYYQRATPLSAGRGRRVG